MTTQDQKDAAAAKKRRQREEFRHAQAFDKHILENHLCSLNSRELTDVTKLGDALFLARRLAQLLGVRDVEPGETLRDFQKFVFQSQPEGVQILFNFDTGVIDSNYIVRTDDIDEWIAALPFSTSYTFSEFPPMPDLPVPVRKEALPEKAALPAEAHLGAWKIILADEEAQRVYTQLHPPLSETEQLKKDVVELFPQTASLDLYNSLIVAASYLFHEPQTYFSSKVFATLQNFIDTDPSLNTLQGGRSIAAAIAKFQSAKHGKEFIAPTAQRIDFLERQRSYDADVQRMHDGKLREEVSTYLVSFRGGE
jgi:hypothetical protein